MAGTKTPLSKNRKALLRRVAAASNKQLVKVIPFKTDDAPTYLQNLEQFETWSRRPRTRIVAK